MTKISARYPERLQRVVDYVAAHLDQSLDLDTLAGVAHFSPYHFHRLYRGVLGETVNDTVRRLRLRRSAIDLLDPEQNIDRVARRAGYSSQAAFTRAFRSEYGDPPARYRDAHRVAAIEHGDPDLYHVEHVVLPRMRVAAIHHLGDYQLTAQAFERLMAVAATRGVLTAATRTFGIYRDDPISTPQAEPRRRQSHCCDWGERQPVRVFFGAGGGRCCARRCRKRPAAARPARTALPSGVARPD